MVADVDVEGAPVLLLAAAADERWIGDEWSGSVEVVCDSRRRSSSGLQRYARRVRVRVRAASFVRTRSVLATTTTAGAAANIVCYASDAAIEREIEGGTSVRWCERVLRGTRYAYAC